MVEGTISNGITSIKLSRSIGINDDFSGLDYEKDGTVWVETKEGVKSTSGTHIGQGIYEIEEIELAPDKEYSLRISINGQEYQSDYLVPIYTPEIDSIYWLKKEAGAPVRICVATHDDKEQSHYYCWSYKENWEIRSRYIARLVEEFINGVPTEVEYDTNTPNNIFGCWAKDSSQVLLLGSSEKLSEYRLPQKELIEMEPTDDRLSVLYHVAIEQTQLRRETYLYLYNLQKNIESGSGLFASMPTEIRGNIHNINNPYEIVIGYIEVATVTNKERYLYVAEGAYEYPYSSCRMTTDPKIAEEYELIMYDRDMQDTYYSSRDCFDCRRARKATKNKPSWWPLAWPL